MRTRLALLVLLASCAQHTAHPVTVNDSEANLTPPIATREPHPVTIHGHTLTDDYFWMRKKDSPEILAYLHAENAYTDQAMQPTLPLQQTLYDEMLARIQETDASVPERRDGWFYYNRTVETLQYPIVCRKSAARVAKNDLVGATATAQEQVLIDLNEIGKTSKYVGLADYEVTDDGNTLAYLLDTTGFRQFTLLFKNLTTGAMYADKMERVDSIAWALDGKALFYVVEDATSKRPYRAYKHRLGDDPAKDVLVYEEKDEMFDLEIDRTRSKAYFTLVSSSKTTSETRVLSTEKPDGAWKIIEPRQHDHEYYVDHRNGLFYIRTNSPAKDAAGKSINFRLVTAPVATPDRKHWKEIVPHRPDVMLEGVSVFAHQLVLHERADALPRLRVLFDKGEVTIPMPEPIYAASGSQNPEFDSPAYRFNYQSLVTPSSVYDFDWKTHELTLRKRINVKGYDPAGYEEARAFATASDGTKIPISLVYKKGTKPDHAHPTLLYGYGSYGISMPPTFSSSRVSLLDRGVVYAIAHIRGGGDQGKAWHEAGRMATKMNTFTDFIASAEALIAQGWTSKDKLAMQGGSAGGLLMGAVMNLRPDLWKCVVAQVPFVDVLNTMLDETLPLTVGEFEEWGNPKKPAEFDVMAKYSPYDNVAKKDYPSLLVMTSYNDSQVMYWEPAKWVARLRATKTDNNPLLLKINMEPAGHGGQSGRYNQLHETAFLYAFVLEQLGITR